MKAIAEALVRDGWAITAGAETAELATFQKRMGAATVSLTLKDDGDCVRLHRMRADPVFSGGGKAGLQALCDAADLTETPLTLVVRPFASKALDERGLERLYGSFGFEGDPYAADYSAMIRPASRPESRPDWA